VVNADAVQARPVTRVAVYFILMVLMNKIEERKRG
jgi:hypothetical protein